MQPSFVATAKPNTQNTNWRLVQTTIFSNFKFSTRKTQSRNDLCISYRIATSYKYQWRLNGILLYVSRENNE